MSEKLESKERQLSSKHMRDKHKDLPERKDWAMEFNPSISSFDEVVSIYNRIVPIRGKDTGLRKGDRRPLGRRWTWWERVMKFDDNTYALCDGHEAWYGMTPNAEDIKNSAPILWERREDGDYITIQNHISRYNTSYTRFDFLNYHTPKGIAFWHYMGQHYLNYDGEDMALPKSVSKWNGNVRTIVQHNAITFLHKDGKFIRQSKLLPVPTKRKSEVAYTYHDKVVALWEWSHVVLPVLGTDLNWDTFMGYARKLTDEHSGIWSWWRDVKPNDLLEILDND